MGNQNQPQSKAKLYTAIGALMVLLAGIGAATAFSGEISGEAEGEVGANGDTDAPEANAALAADVAAALEEAEAIHAEGQLAADTALSLDDVQGSAVEAEAAALVESLDTLEAAIATEATAAIADLPAPELETLLVQIEAAVAGVEEQLQVLDGISVTADANVSAAGQDVSVSGVIG